MKYLIKSTRTFEIYYLDLNDDCKKRYLEFQRVSDVSELNDDLCPLAMIDVEDEEERDVFQLQQGV